ncbi:MAG TPA: aldo/keto reductase, partial [Cyclobacteriaceae bacterium]
FQRWGTTDVKEATRLIDVSLDHGMNFFDTANVYSLGDSEKILGAALRGKRDRSLIATKSTFKMGEGVNDYGSSRYHIIRQVETSLKSLNTEYIDVYFMHAPDSTASMDETLRALDDIIRSGKVRYIGASNFSSWQFMKALSISEREHLNKYVIYQGYYSLIGRDYEWDLMPLLQDQRSGLMVWSPLGWGRLTGKIKSGQPLPEGRIKAGGEAGGPAVDEELLFKTIALLETISLETGKSVPQVAINWLLQNPTVSNVVLGARNEEQLIQNLGAVDWKLSSDQIERLNTITAQQPLYPHWVGAR